MNYCCRYECRPTPLTTATAVDVDVVEDADIGKSDLNHRVHTITAGVVVDGVFDDGV